MDSRVHEEHVDEVYPKGYQVSTVIYSHVNSDSCLTIEKYSGVHSDEYLECFRVDGQKTGIGTLYKNGSRILQCYFDCNILHGWGTLYRSGVPFAQVLWENDEAVRTVLLSGIENSKWIDERSVDGSLVYTGEYDICSYNRDGYGVVYSNSEISLFGQFENGELIHIFKTFSNDQMKEYNEYNATVYIGDYENSIEKQFPRSGQGKEFVSFYSLK